MGAASASQLAHLGRAQQPRMDSGDHRVAVMGIETQAKLLGLLVQRHEVKDMSAILQIDRLRAPIVLSWGGLESPEFQRHPLEAVGAGMDNALASHG